MNGDTICFIGNALVLLLSAFPFIYAKTHNGESIFQKLFGGTFDAPDDDEDDEAIWWTFYEDR